MATELCLRNTALDHIWELHLCFRFDKSKNSFTIHKYTRLPIMSFDPVIAAINIICRAHLIGILSNEPLSQYQAIGSSTDSLLRDHDIRDNMRVGCRLAYPTPNHYCYRIYILRLLVAHSTRVTAALCLKLGSAPPQMAHCQCTYLSLRVLLRHRSTDAYRNHWHLLYWLTYTISS